MRKELGFFKEVNGLWVSETKSIIIKRDTLKSIEEYAEVLLHEIAHVISGAHDVSREFELILSKLLEIIVKQKLEKELVRAIHPRPPHQHPLITNAPSKLFASPGTLDIP